MPKRLAIILAVAVVLGGCAVGNTYDYASRTPEFSPVSSGETVAVGVQDRRGLNGTRVSSARRRL